MIHVLVAKELQVDAGSRRTAVARSLLLGCILVGLLAGMARFSLGSGDHSEIPRYGRAMFTFIAWTLCVGALLLGPLQTLGAISGERRRGTIGILALAGFSPAQLVLGKFAARFVATAWTIVATLPVLLFLEAYGGVSHAEIVAVYLTALSAAAWGCALGIALSTVTEEGPVAVVAAAGIVALACGLPLVLVRTGAPAGLLAWVGPLATLHNILTLGLLTEGDLRIGAPWVAANALLLLQAAGLLGIATIALPRMSGAGLSVGAGLERWLSRLDRFVPRFIPTSEQVLQAPDPDGAANPFAWREAYGRSGLGLRSVAALVLVVLVLQAVAYTVLADRLDEPTFHRIAILGLAGAAVLVVTALAGSSIASEKEDKTLETLALLEVTPYRYAYGKFYGLFSIALVLSVPAVAHALVFWLAGMLNYLVPLAVAVAVPAMAACGIVHGLWCSLRLRSVAQAVATSVIAQTLFHGAQFLAGFLCCLLHLVNPLYLLVAVLNMRGPASGHLVDHVSVLAAAVVIALLTYRANAAYVDWVLWKVANGFHREVTRHLEGEARDERASAE